MSDKYLNESGLGELRSWIINKLQGKQDTLETYIVDVGMTSSWRYIKYSDGTYHAWRKVNLTSSGSNATKNVSLTLPSWNRDTNYIVNVVQNADTYITNTYRVDTISATGFRIVATLSSATTASISYAVSVWGYWN